MSAVYTVLSPWAQSDHLEKRPINPRLDTLEGKTIGLYASFKEYHPFFMQEVERQLAAKAWTVWWAWGRIWAPARSTWDIFSPRSSGWASRPAC